MTTLARRNNGSSLDARDPIYELNRLMGEIDSVLERTLASHTRPGLSRLWSGAFTPLAGIGETSDAYVIEVELPGLRREDASIEVQGRRIVVTGERKERERTGIFRTKTRGTGRFHYEAVLPDDIDPDSVTASSENGVLVIRAPKPESQRTKGRRIRVR